MWERFIAALFILGCVALPRNASGQVMEEEEIQTLRALPGAAAEKEKPDRDQAEKLILEEINQFRQEQGLQSVATNPSLSKAAESFAEYMARTNRYGHTADGQRPAERAMEHGYEYCIVTENIAYQYSSAGFTTAELAEKFAEGWKQSPGHRKNILDADVADTGVGIARSDETGYYYAVQMFGRPKSQSIEFQVTNESPVTIQYQIGEQSFPLPPRYSRTHQQCRPSELTFQFPGGEGGQGRTRAMKPSAGDQFTVVQEQGQIQVKEK